MEIIKKLRISGSFFYKLYFTKFKYIILLLTIYKKIFSLMIYLNIAPFLYSGYFLFENLYLYNHKCLLIH